MLKGYGVSRLASLISYTGGIDEILSGKGYPVKCGEQRIKLPSIKLIDEAKRLAEKEMPFIEKHQINVHFFRDDSYPHRLKNCYGAPVVLFGKGAYQLNNTKVIGIVGTRKSTAYGEKICRQIIETLKPYNVLVVSGMAYGIDVCAHKTSLEFDIPTIAVMAHGLDRLYPSLHKNIAREMIVNSGGLITEYTTGTNPDRERFPARNRIVAGMCDALIVVESANKGGSLITADMAFNFNRDVFAVPGDVGREFSKGCNRIIKEQKASMLTDVNDIVKVMNWDLQENKEKNIQRKLFLSLSQIEKSVISFVDEKPFVTIDELMVALEIKTSKLATVLLQLEMKGMILQLPGKRF